jgi:hypothetical protein
MTPFFLFNAGFFLSKTIFFLLLLFVYYDEGYFLSIIIKFSIFFFRIFSTVVLEIANSKY